MLTLRKVLVLLVATTGMALAAPPDVEQIVKQMQAAVDPDRPSIRRLTFRISAYEEETTQVVVGQARKKVGGKGMILNILLAPEGQRGIGLLVQDQVASDDDAQWVYVPFVRRVRKLVSPEAYESFLNSDFNYADLGF